MTERHDIKRDAAAAATLSEVAAEFAGLDDEAGNSVDAASNRADKAVFDRWHNFLINIAPDVPKV